MKTHFFIYLAIAIALGVTPLILIPPVDSLTIGLDSALLFILPIFVTQVGALWYFLSSLHAFQPELRKAYKLLAFGLIAFCAAQLQLPLTIFLSLQNIDPTLVQLLLLVPYLFGTFLMYIAMRSFARILHVSFVWTSLWKVVVLGLLLVVLAFILPKQAVPDVPDSPRFILALIAWSGAFGVAAAVVAWRIRQAIGKLFRPSMTFLTWALAAFGTGYLLVVIFQTLGSYIPPFIDTYTKFNLWLLPLTITSILFLRAGQLVKAVGQHYGQLPDNATALDVVISVANLAADPTAIDPIMDPVRTLTATKKPGEQLTAQDTQTLISVYTKLEDYLVTKEPLRRYERNGLREHLPAEFRAQITK